MYDVVIVGGGPAGVSAGVYAARKQLRTALITDSFGGQSIVSDDIQNWIGTPHISGADLAQSFETHVREYANAGLDIVDNARVTNIEKKGESFSVTDSNGATYETKTVLVASGGTRRQLSIPGAEKFEHKGLTYCASCDGPLFAGMDVAVIGGGNAGFETAAQLLAYASSVTLLQRNTEFKADPITIEKVLAHPKMSGFTNTEPVEILGDTFVSGLVYKNKATNETKEIPVRGIFVEIGMIPSTDFVKDIVATDDVGRIITDPKNQRTTVPGIWAAGDCTDALYHQNNIAAGDGVKALEDMYLYLNAR
jgi:NADH-dependent peroxiredoxin subunit F